MKNISNVRIDGSWVMDCMSKDGDVFGLHRLMKVLVSNER